MIGLVNGPHFPLHNRVKDEGHFIVTDLKQVPKKEGLAVSWRAGNGMRLAGLLVRRNRT